MKIAIIGAGGFVFPLRLIGDILSFMELQDVTLSLMDIDASTLDRTARAARELVAHHRLPTRIETTTNRRSALERADYVIVTFQVGGLEAYRHDVDIPRQYGLDQTVGDTLGPGGVFRFLRSAPAYREIVADMLEVCPGALLINYANPMAMACWYLSSLGIKTVGLCHSVQGTSRMLAEQLNVPYDELHYLSAGINHQAWFLEFKHGREDLLPRMREVMKNRFMDVKKTVGLASDNGDHSGKDRKASVYEGVQERVRTELMTAFGYFNTESSHHASEYSPYFRKNPQLIEAMIPERWDYFQVCSAHDETSLDELLARLKTRLEPSLEYGAQIIHSMETGSPRVIYGNVPNDGLIKNLPDGCCVEVPCLVDANGIQPTAVGSLPPQCAAVNRTNINVQELAVQAALTGNLDHVYQAVMLDPLTAGLLTLTEIRAMVDEMIQAEAQWLPEFASRSDSSIGI